MPPAPSDVLHCKCLGVGGISRREGQVWTWCLFPLSPSPQDLHPCWQVFSRIRVPCTITYGIRAGLLQKGAWLQGAGDIPSARRDPRLQ